VSYRPRPADRAARAAFAALLGLPAPVRHAVARRPHIVDGEPLDPDVVLGLRVLGRAAAQPEPTVAEARRRLERDAWVFGGQPEAVGAVEDLTIAGPDGAIPVRLYRPATRAGTETQPDPPLLLWFHGGGWVVGSIDSHDSLCRAVCSRAEVAVLNVGYRLAPEHPFPAAVEDCVAAFRWAATNAESLGVDVARLAVGGDSAGGNLAAVVAQETSRDGGPAPAFQVLVVPAVDFSGDRPSKELFGTGYLLDRAKLDWYEDLYLGDHPRDDPRCSPLLAEDLSGLPPAYVAVAGFDPLRDEGIAYADALRAAGVEVSLRVHGDAVHPFLGTLVTELGQRALSEVVGAVRMGLRV
jgi:acetyl esterase